MRILNYEYVYNSIGYFLGDHYVIITTFGNCTIPKLFENNVKTKDVLVRLRRSNSSNTQFQPFCRAM